ncbi:MAG: hypothetical protein C0485_04295 [Pirellula sp.]|nr:hypothetical protein [Pirellula sp.]
MGAEAYNLVLAPPVEKRLHSWRTEVGARLSALEASSTLTIESLQSDDVFIDVMVKASQIAVSTHAAEKLEALRNAVINSALGIDIDSARQQLFLRYVDELTPIHLQVLRFMQNTEAGSIAAGVPPRSIVVAGSLLHVIKDAFPALVKDEGFVKVIQSDLDTRGLIASLGRGFASRDNRMTTSHGDAFLAFVSRPATEFNEAATT